jgi:hypothetical protein
MGSALYDKAKAAAEKILGKSAKVPDLPPGIEKAFDAKIKANEAFDKSREDLEAKLVEVQNANDGVKNLANQFEAKMEKEDFGLDTKNKDDVKKIQQARKIMTDVLKTGTKNLADDDKILNELDKHVIQLGKYKPSKSGL